MHTDPTTTIVPETTTKATIYTRGDMGMGWTGVRVTRFKVDAAARHMRIDLEVRCRRFRHRSDSTLHLWGRKELVIVAGHHEERPIPIYGEATTAGGVTTAKGRASSCSPMWDTWFDQWLADKSVIFDGRTSTPDRIAA